jgi:cobalt-precorrin 5A hydrolase
MTPPDPAAVRIVALTPAGAALGRHLLARLPGSTLWLPAKLQPEYPEARPFESLKVVFAEAFQAKAPLAGIMATGIAVRHAAPLLQGKDSDPAVVIMDERGQFAISLLSGHLGGANALARTVAALVGATPVITTASDIQGLPAIDNLAAGLGLVIENLAMVKKIQMAWLQGRKVRLIDPAGFLQKDLADFQDLIKLQPEQPEFLNQPGPAVYVGIRNYQWPEDWLRLRPKILMAGMGCNKGTPAAEILGLLENTFNRFKLSLHSLHSLATIAAKQGEAGLQAAAARFGVNFIWYSKEELQQITVPNPSSTVQRHMGVASVCEAAALRAAGAGTLLVPKQKTANVTLAVAQAGWLS